MTTQDSLLYIGEGDEKLQRLLGKLGYSVTAATGTTSCNELLAKQTFDLIILDSRIECDSRAFCEYLRNDDNTKRIPIVYLAKSPMDAYELKQVGYDRLELVDVPYSIGVLASRVAMQVRLSKMAGAQDEAHATLGEVNAALRDYNKKFQRELEDARNIQEGLLPRTLPSEARFEMVAEYEPLEEVGGDWYFVETLPNGNVSVQIADVTGHGLAAAFIGSMAKLAITAAGRENPAELLTEMNRLMTPQLPEGRFVTLGAYTYNPTTREITFGRAGHPAPFILQRATGKVLQPKDPGCPVGFLPDATYKSSTTVLGINDIVLLVTDGIIEAQNRGQEMYGCERVVQSLLATPVTATAKEILKKVLSDFREFMDGRILNDDLTLLLLKQKE